MSEPAIGTPIPTSTEGRRSGPAETSAPISATEAPAISRGREIGILAALLMGLLLGALDNFIVVTALPTIATQLHDISGQVFVVSSYLIAQTVAIPVFGKLSDRFGRRSFYLMGLAIFLVGSALSGFSQNLNELIAFRAVQGLGSGAFFTVVFSIVADIFPPKAAARVAGLLSGVFGVAIVFGPLIGSYIVDTTTWRWIFFVNLPIGFAAIALVLTTFGTMRRVQTTHKFDAVGAGLLALWVGSLIFALLMTSNGWAWTDPRTITLLAIALGLVPVFLWQESRADDPLVPLHFFRIPRVAASSGVNFLRGAILVGVVTFVPILVQFGLGGSADDSRDILYAFMVPMIIGAAMGGQLVARFGYRLPTSTGLAFTTVGCLLLTLVPTVPPLFRFTALIIPIGLAGALIPLGFGIGLTFAPSQMAIQYSVPKEDVGTGSSLVWFLGNLGGSIVVSLLGTYQLSVYNGLKPAGPPPPPPQLYVWLQQTQSALAVSIQHVWWVIVPIAVAGLISALLISGALPKMDYGAADSKASASSEPIPTVVAPVAELRSEDYSS